MVLATPTRTGHNLATLEDRAKSTFGGQPGTTTDVKGLEPHIRSIDRMFQAANQASATRLFDEVIFFEGNIGFERSYSLVSI